MRKALSAALALLLAMSLASCIRSVALPSGTNAGTTPSFFQSF